MRTFGVYCLYNLLLPVVLILGFPGFILKGIRRGGLARGFWQRIGIFHSAVAARLRRGDNIWIHAVSVGEVMVAAKVIRGLLEADPDQAIVLSTTTTTGFRVAEEQAGERVTVIHNPIDLPFVVSRVIDRIRPRRLVLVEAEVWPNLVRQVRKRGVPVVLVNARLSERSERRYRRFGALTRTIFRMLDRVGVPFQEDIARWEALGVPPARIALTGSVKFDEAEGQSQRPDAQISALSGWLAECGVNGPRRILLAGSTHAGEEALIGRAYLALRECFPDLIYVVVPRHAERARQVVADLREAGCHPVLKKPLKGLEIEAGESPASGTDSASSFPRVYVANTTGELRAWFYLADVVVIGKSFEGRGGQNPIEPIVAGKPVIVGPHMNNFSAVVRNLVARRGIIQLGGADQLAGAIDRLLESGEEAAAYPERGKEALRSHRGATARTVAMIREAELAVGVFGGGKSPGGEGGAARRFS